jgi:hypothetical protein
MKSPNNATEIPDVHFLSILRLWPMYYKKENNKNYYIKKKIYKENYSLLCHSMKKLKKEYEFTISIISIKDNK